MELKKKVLTYIQWFYFFINIGALIGQVSMTYAEKVSFVPMCVLLYF